MTDQKLPTQSAQPTIFAFSSIDGPMEHAGPDPDRIVSGTPVAKVRTLVESEDGRISAGMWTCTPGRWRVSYDEYEYCRILSGKGAVIDESGTQTEIGLGDEFIVPAGFVGEWLVTETMSKHFVVLIPGSGSMDIIGGI
ncbi:cupin domain-containing protein [Sphingobium sp. HBC34]|uniref:Cupin domain-containing protein n=1 Tax=Sphingobium cyanobacteriorum TaxID=3063954 RepID=A0ABT8ZS68_9SPHN|nr:cupin domain-containing protein [Sphingobium sp. HBC34]MDO7837380.1 cupin domain-containing protein [Sphingobium sp. HBC34]